MTNEEIFNNNINIAYKIANRYLINYADEIEDIKQIALMGLWKCIGSWDHKHSLTTYAFFCIPNEINMYLRHVKKHENNISINTTIYTQKDDNTLTVENILEDPNDCIFRILDDIDAENVWDNIILNNNEKKVLYLRMKGINQQNCSKIMNMSQGNVSKIQRAIKNKIKKYISEGE